MLLPVTSLFSAAVVYASELILQIVVMFMIALILCSYEDSFRTYRWSKNNRVCP